MLPGQFSELGKYGFGSTIFLANFFFWRGEIQGYFAAAIATKPLLHLWSLGIEEQYYLLWPVLLYLFFSRKWKTIYIVSFFLILSFGINLWAISDHPVFAFFLPPTRFWELMSGSILACMISSGKRLQVNGDLCQASKNGLPDFISTQLRGHQANKRLSDIIRVLQGTTFCDVMAAVGFLLIVLAVLVFIDNTVPFPGWRALLPVLGAVFIIAAGSQAWLNKVLLSNPIAISIGLISYPLYLWHWPLLSFAYILTGHIPSVEIRVGIIFLSVLLSYITYVFIEKPIRFQGRLPRPVLVLSSIMGILSFGFLLAYASILPGRLSNSMFAKNIETAATEDWNYPGGNMGKAYNFKIVDTNIKASSKILFVGDSHIEQYWERAHFLSLQNNNTQSALFSTYGGCPPLPLINRFSTNNYTKYSCDNFYSFSMKRAQEDDVKIVVLGANWQGYFSALHAEPYSANNLLYLVAEKTKEPLGFYDSEIKDIFAVFKKDILRLKGAGKDVYIILQSPVGEEFNPLSMYGRLRDSVDIKTKKGLEKRKLVSRVRPLSEHLQEIAFVTGARIIDPLDVLCPDGTCPAITQDGIPLYRDDNHMRPFYVKEKAVFIDQIFGGR
jgi:peptidoglycan/LPS O-acetylase OafA/YrhL